MLRISRRELEVLSRKVLKQYLALCEAPVDRIDPVDFTEKMCGIKFSFCNLSFYNEMQGLYIHEAEKYGITLEVWGKDGIIESCPTDSQTVFIDERLRSDELTGVCNFTMMHEAAHRILKATFPLDYNKPVNACSVHYYSYSQIADRKVDDWYEWQANAFTSCLLLPRELVHKHMERVGLNGQIRLLNKIFAPKEYALFCTMADSLGVSKTALSIRLDQMGLISRNDFRNPYALVDVYPDDEEVA